MVRNNSWVGLVEPCQALVQHKTQLYMLNLANLSADLLYQQVSIVRCLSYQPGMVHRHCCIHACAWTERAAQITAELAEP